MIMCCVIGISIQSHFHLIYTYTEFGRLVASLNEAVCRPARPP